MTFITEIQEKYPKIHMEAQKTVNSESSFEQKEES
jgi:hypothetical protein